MVVAPERMHLVHTMAWAEPPFWLILTFCKLGFDTFFVLLLACDILFPFSGLLPHIAHILGIVSLL